MKTLPLLIFSLFAVSCGGKKENFNYETSIGAKVYQAQVEYLDNTLANYARMSEKSLSYYIESNTLDSIARSFKNKLEDGQPVSESDKANFYRRFEKMLTGHKLVDIKILDELKTLPVKTASDVDLLRLYVKNSFVSILLDNKLLPFDYWSIMATAEKWTINDGETFVAELGNLASNMDHPNQWFVLKEGTDSLTAENVSDTLTENERGLVYFETNKYKKGKNVVTVVSKMNAPGMDHHVLTREIEFFVK